MRYLTKTGHSFYLDDVDIIDYGFFMEPGHENPALVDGRNYVSSVPGMPGQLFYGNDPGPIPFSIPINTLQQNRFDLQQQVRLLKSIFHDSNGRKKTVKLKFSYEPDKYYNVRYDGDVSFERIFESGRATLPLICDEGFALSVAENDEITWGSEDITFTADFTLGHMGSGEKMFTAPGTTTFTVTGANLRPSLHVTGSGTDVTIGWGEKVMSLGTFTDATWLIDLQNFEVLKDGMNALHLISGDWLDMVLTQGDNTIEVNGSGLNLTLRAEYRDRFY